MARTIRRLIILGISVALLNGIGGIAAAQSGDGADNGPADGRGPGMMGDGPGMGGGPGMMGRHHGMAGRGMMGGAWDTGHYLGALKTKLAITAAEEPAWKDYAETVSGVAEQMRGIHQTMSEEMATASWPHRREMMNTMFEAHQQAFDTVHEAADKLLTALDPAQKEKAKRILPGLVRGHGMMHGHGPVSPRP